MLVYGMTEKHSALNRFSKINCVFQLRNLRTLELISELEDFKIIVQTTKNITAPIFSKLMYMYVVYYIFAIVGMKAFGGEINLQSVADKSP